MRTLVTFITLAVLFGSIQLWWWAFRRLRRGEPLLPLEPRPPVPWGLIDIVVAILVLFTLQLGVVQFLPPSIKPLEGASETATEPRSLVLLLALNAVLQIATLAVSLTVLKLRQNLKLTDLGFSVRQFWSDVRLGALSFVMIAPPVYLIQVVLVQFFPKFHPLIEQLRKTPDATLLIASGLTVTLVAPLCEEYLFRGLLQGWLESLRGSLTSDESILGAKRSMDTITFDGQPALPPTITTVPKWPILVSSLLFAGAHFSHGPAPIALFFLAIGLGYLYQRTHRLLPCIVVHFLLNGWTIVVMLIEIYSPLPK